MWLYVKLITIKYFRKTFQHSLKRFSYFYRMKKIEHIGIAVKDLEESNKLFASLLGKPHYKIEEVFSEGVKTSFFESGSNKIELLEATDAESPIAKFIEKKGEGVHHIAFAVDDIKSEISRLKREGFIVLNETPKKGADNKLVAFLHPKSTNGVLIELCEEID
jgi:methylmalonyl-CoA/ethylmalonyl-CoA epimerase